MGATAESASPWPHRRLVTRLALGLVLLQAVLRGWTALRGYFYIDDFTFTGRSMEFPVWSREYLLHPYNSHVMPGSYVWAWLTTHAFPLDWAPVALVMIALQTLLALAVWRLLVELFGPRPAILPPLALALLSPVSLPAFLWWAAALNQLPQQLAIVLALWGHVRYLRGGGLRRALVGPVALAGGLLFSEKSLFLLPLVVAVTLAFFAGGGPLRRVGWSLRRHGTTWIAYAAVALPYLAYYVLEVPTPLRETAKGADVADLATQFLFRATLPGLLGGPWQWTRVGFAGALADPNGYLVTVATAAAVLVVGLSVALWRRAAFAWLILLGYVTVNIALLASSRATVIGPVIGTEYRYQTDIAIVAAVCLALATIPLPGPYDRAEVQPLLPREPARAWLEERVSAPLRAAGALPADGAALARGTAVGAAAFLTASAGWTSVRYDPLWVDNPAKPYVTNVLGGLARLPEGTVLADGPVPADVAWPLIYPYNQSYRVFSPVLTGAQRLDPGDSAAVLVVPDDGGLLRRAAVSGPTAEKGPAAGCGWVLGPSAVTIPLTEPATDAAPIVRIGYIATGRTTLTVRINGTSTKVTFEEGLGSVFIGARGPVRSLAVDATSDNGRVCTDDVTAGAPVAIPGSGP